MEAAVLFRVMLGQNVVILKSSMRVVQIGKSPCKGWYSIVQLGVPFLGQILPWQTNSTLIISIPRFLGAVIAQIGKDCNKDASLRFSGKKSFKFQFSAALASPTMQNAECKMQNEGIPCGDGFENQNNLVISSEAEKFVRISQRSREIYALSIPKCANYRKDPSTRYAWSG